MTDCREPTIEMNPYLHVVISENQRFYFVASERSLIQPWLFVSINNRMDGLAFASRNDVARVIGC